MTVSPAPTARAEPVIRLGTRPGIVLAIIVSCQMMFVVDTTAMTVALPAIQSDLHLSTVGLSWVLNAYLLAFGGMLLLGGRAGDVFGHRTTFVAGIVLFTACSALGGVATAGWWLISARALQGAGAALAAPAAMSLLVTSFRESQARNRALAVYSTVAGLGMAIGMLMGGALTTLVSWRLVLGVNVPIGLAAAVLAPRFIEPAPRHGGRLGLDGLVATGGVTALVWGLTRAAAAGWDAALTVAALAAAAALLGLFVMLQARVAHPIMPLRLFRDPRRVAGYLAMLLTLACNFSVFFFVPQFLQEILRYSPLKAAIAFLPLGVIMFAVSRLAPVLLTRLGTRPLILAGLALVVGGVTWLGQLTATTGYVPVLFASTVMIGAGIGTFLMPLTGMILSGVPRQDTGIASGVLQTTQQAGGALGLASLVTVYETTVRHAAPGVGQLPAVISHGMANAFYGGSIFVGCAILVILLMPGARRAASS